jgi:hypothetical protein
VKHHRIIKIEMDDWPNIEGKRLFVSMDRSPFRVEINVPNDIINEPDVAHEITIRAVQFMRDLDALTPIRIEGLPK